MPRSRARRRTGAECNHGHPLCQRGAVLQCGGQRFAEHHSRQLLESAGMLLRVTEQYLRGFWPLQTFSVDREMPRADLKLYVGLVHDVFEPVGLFGPTGSNKISVGFQIVRDDFDDSRAQLAGLAPSMLKQQKAFAQHPAQVQTVKPNWRAQTPFQKSARFLSGQMHGLTPYCRVLFHAAGTRAR
jgi:hypothetical protein